jgi:hypothetical protein
VLGTKGDNGTFTAKAGELDFSISPLPILYSQKIKKKQKKKKILSRLVLK